MVVSGKPTVKYAYSIELEGLLGGGGGTNTKFAPEDDFKVGLTVWH
jgi:hypothetical protein